LYQTADKHKKKLRGHNIHASPSDFRKKKNSNITKIRLVGAELFYADRRTDRQTQRS